MRNHLKTSVVTAFLLSVLVPQVALAAWWNPFTWTMFSKKEVSVAQEHSVTLIATTTPKKTVPRTLIFEKKVDVKTISSPDSSAIIKEQARIKAEATLKAQAEQDALIAKQKVDERARIDAVRDEADRQAALLAQAQQWAAQQAEKDRLTAERVASLVAQQAEQDRISGITQQIKTLQQQIIDIKTRFYAESSGAGSTGTSVVAQGNVDMLMYQANQKIGLINLQIQQLQLQY